MKRDRFVTVGIGIHEMTMPDIYDYKTTVKNLSEGVNKITSVINRAVKTEFQS